MPETTLQPHVGDTVKVVGGRCHKNLIGKTAKVVRLDSGGWVEIEYQSEQHGIVYTGGIGTEFEIIERSQTSSTIFGLIEQLRDIYCGWRTYTALEWIDNTDSTLAELYGAVGLSFESQSTAMAKDDAQPDRVLELFGDEFNDQDWTYWRRAQLMGEFIQNHKLGETFRWFLEAKAELAGARDTNPKGV